MTPERRRDLLAYALLFGLIGAILALLPSAKWHSALSCDSRTHVEMIRGVARHGLPYTTNGPVSRFPELQARWNFMHAGRLWGTYPPLFAYLAAPFFRMGGLAAVSRMNVVVLALLALAIFALAQTFLQDRLWAAVATVLAVAGTPIPPTAFDMSPYVIADLFLVLALLLAMTARDGPWSTPRLVGAGVAGALAITAHLFTFPLVAGLLVALAVPPATSVEPPLVRIERLGRWISLVPTRATTRRAVTMLAGLIVGLVPVCLLNRMRFGSPNPISYGPCVWRSCVDTGQSQQHMGDMLRFAAPTLIAALALVGAVTILASHRRLAVGIVVLTVLAFVLVEPWRIEAWRLARVAWANLFDLSWINMENPAFRQPEDGVGSLLGPWLVRSPLQCSPFLLAAPLALLLPRTETRDGRFLVLPSILAFVALCLRANQPIAHAVGFPLLFLRYTTPIVALLVLPTVAVLRRLEWRSWHLAFGVAIAGVVCAFLWGADDDTLARRVFLLYGTLATGLVLCALAWKSLRGGSDRIVASATIAATLCIAISVGSILGASVSPMLRLRDGEDARADIVASVVPSHAGIFGYSNEIDIPLAVLGDRDVEYADLYETKNDESVKRLVDEWTADGRPVFAFLYPDTDIPQRFDELVFEPVIPQELIFRVRKR